MTLRPRILWHLRRGHRSIMAPAARGRGAALVQGSGVQRSLLLTKEVGEALLQVDDRDVRCVGLDELWDRDLG